MKKIILCLAALFGLTLAPVQAQSNELTLRDITDGAYSPRYVYGVKPMRDGEHYSQLSSDYRRIVVSSFRTGKETSTLFDAAKAQGPVKLETIDGYILSPDEQFILLQTKTKAIYRRSFTAEYYLFDVKNNSFVPLSTGGPQQVPQFSPDGNVIGFVREGNLFIVKLLYGNAEIQVTKDGKFNEIINGIPDWVNEEEFSTNCSFGFSADSQMLAWVRYDESGVDIYHMQMFKGSHPAHADNDLYPGEYAYKYPVAGTPNSKVSVHSYDIKNRVTRTLKVPLDADGYIPRIHFTDDPTKLAVITLNRHQNRMEVYMVNPRSTEAKMVLRETNDRYIREAAYTDMKFYKGHFSLLSERTGYQQLYWYTLNGQLEQTVTKGNFEVTHFYGYDEAAGRFFYSARAESPLRQEVYMADRKGKVTRLSQKTGTNSATFSTTMKYFMNVYSSAQQPPVTSLCDATGKTLTTLMDNADLKQKVNGRLGTKEFFTFTTSEGVQLNGWMVKPKDFDPARRHPVIM